MEEDIDLLLQNYDEKLSTNAFKKWHEGEGQQEECSRGEILDGVTHRIVLMSRWMIKRREADPYKVTLIRILW